MNLTDLDEKQRCQILQSQDFSEFFRRGTRIIERTLVDGSDIFIDYAAGDRNAHESQSISKDVLVFNTEFSMKKYTENRYVRSLDYSWMYPELLIAAYDRDPTKPLAPEGIVNVWNTHLKATPEFKLYCSSRVTSMLCDKFQPNIIVAGCYSGQICLWDTRANKSTPMCKTKFYENPHTYPVMCMQMVGLGNFRELVTLSTDGLMCSWSMFSLQSPTQTLSFVCNSRPTENASKSDAVDSTPGKAVQTTVRGCHTENTKLAALSMSFFSSSISAFVIGSEDKALYLGNRHSNNGEIVRCIEAHEMPLTCVSMHPAVGLNEFSSLCLSGSMDFYVKLWDLNEAYSADFPLITFRGLHSHYVTDVQWSPVHPAVFSAASIDGTLNLWNLNENIDRPVLSLKLSNSITKLIWSRNGKQLSVGSVEGKVFLYDVHESLYNIRLSDWDNFSQTLASLRAMSQDIVCLE